jgi:hypothetical protein
MWLTPHAYRPGLPTVATVASAVGRYPSPGRWFYFLSRGAGHLRLWGPVNSCRRTPTHYNVAPVDKGNGHVNRPPLATQGDR